MEQSVENERLITRYLLGSLSEEDKERLEDQCLGSNDLFEELLIIESELIDRYVRGELSDSERKQFEAYFLTSASRHERVENARVINKWRATPHPNTRSHTTEFQIPPRWSLSEFWRGWALKWAAGFAVIAIALTASWFIRKSLQRPTGPISQQKIVFELLPGAVRSGDKTSTLEIGPDDNLVEFRLYLERSRHRKFNATLQTATGRRIKEELGLEAEQFPSGNAVVMSLPANMFSSGDYFITLASENDKGTADIMAEYQFKVVKR